MCHCFIYLCYLLTCFLLQLLVHSIKNLAATDASTETIDLSLKRSHALSNQMKLQLMQMRILEIDSTSQKLEQCLRKTSESVSDLNEPEDISSDVSLG